MIPEMEAMGVDRGENLSVRHPGGKRVLHEGGQARPSQKVRPRPGHADDAHHGGKLRRDEHPQHLPADRADGHPVSGRRHHRQKRKALRGLCDEVETSPKKTKLVFFTNEVENYMHASDLLITKPGGLTVSEALACNIPLAVFDAIPGQEEDNADFLLTLQHGGQAGARTPTAAPSSARCWKTAAASKKCAATARSSTSPTPPKTSSRSPASFAKSTAAAPKPDGNGSIRKQAREYAEKAFPRACFFSVLFLFRRIQQKPRFVRD